MTDRSAVDGRVSARTLFGLAFPARGVLVAEPLYLLFDSAVVRTMSTTLSISSGRSPRESSSRTIAQTRPSPSAAEGINRADPSTEPSMGSQANGWVSRSRREMAAPSIPVASRRSASVCEPGRTSGTIRCP